MHVSFSQGIVMFYLFFQSCEVQITSKTEARDVLKVCLEQLQISVSRLRKIIPAFLCLPSHRLIIFHRQKNLE